MYPRKVISVHINLVSDDETKQLKEVHCDRFYPEIINIISTSFALYLKPHLSHYYYPIFETVTQTVETQCEMDEEMTVRNLTLETQGTLESYLPSR